MNGRVYDPELGRFTGVDPFMTSPLNAQTLNPYSYVSNNPIMKTDPTGYCEAATGTHIKKCETVKITATDKETGKTSSRTVRYNSKKPKEMASKFSNAINNVVNAVGGNGAQWMASQSDKINNDSTKIGAIGSRSNNGSSSGAIDKDFLKDYGELFSEDDLKKYAGTFVKLAPDTTWTGLSLDQKRMFAALDFAVGVYYGGIQFFADQGDGPSSNAIIAFGQTRWLYSKSTSADDFASADTGFVPFNGGKEMRAVDTTITFHGLTASNFRKETPPLKGHGYTMPVRRGAAGVLDVVVHEAGHAFLYDNNYRQLVSEGFNNKTGDWHKDFERQADSNLGYMRGIGVIP